ncbi:hypothetical protein QAD02_000510 [Eretmocerus hayati]|uniref:Uncharacterized protein n=1 Tax=Eretmocerus hayati TaxID=131215 RepID=A0ACC2NF44_9HYME|nr:hypothetical protein QAD02_000510 [Eretmocerus hayati]
MAPQNAPVQPARGGLPEDERRSRRTRSLLARVWIFQGSELTMTGTLWTLMNRCDGTIQLMTIWPIRAERVIAVINTTEPVEGAPSETKEVEQEEENDDNESDAMVDESVENNSVEAESVEDESVYWRKPARPQPPRLYVVRPTTALGAPPVDEERQRLESRLQEEMAERVRRRQEAQYYRRHIDALRSKKTKQHGRKSEKGIRRINNNEIVLRNACMLINPFVACPVSV